jgi:hypothetical protein
MMKAKKMSFNRWMVYGILWISSTLTFAQTSVLPEQVVGAIEKQFGVTPGQREITSMGFVLVEHLLGIKIFRHIQILYCFQVKIYQLLEDSL